MLRASWGPQHQWFSRASCYSVCIVCIVYSVSYCEPTFRSSHWHMMNPVSPLSAFWSCLSYVKVLVSWEFQVGSQGDPRDRSPSGPLRIDSGDATLVLSDSFCSTYSLHLLQPGSLPSTDLTFLFLVFGWPVYSAVIVSSALLHGGSHISICHLIIGFLGNAYSYRHWTVNL